MISFSGLFSGGWGHTHNPGQKRFWNSLFSGFRTFLPIAEAGDTFTRSKG
jgi:hypothetical protein